MDKKTTVVLLFGGKSAEHDVSITSANSLIGAIEPNRLNLLIIPVYQAIDGIFLPPGESVLKIESHLHSRCTIKGYENHTFAQLLSLNVVDVVFPLIHGSFGEDGTLQGFLEILGIPYVGAGVLSSAICMDKIVTKQICSLAHIPVLPFEYFTLQKWNHESAGILSKIKSAIGFPLFTKPANAGSSIGISKVLNEEQLIPAILYAFQFDQKIIVEKGIEPREIEISVMGNEEILVSEPGEIIPGSDFYDYNDKYINGKSKSIIPAVLEIHEINRIKLLAKKVAELLNVEGMARIDFLIEKNTNQIYLNEVNTIPGFTPISMFPKMWEASGISYPQLIKSLINLAIQRFSKREMIFNNFKNAIKS